MKKQIDIILSTTCEHGLAQGGFSAVSAAVSLATDAGYERSFFHGGVTRTDFSGASINGKTFFDLASLTKPLCTALSVGYLIDKGQLSWDTPCLSLLTPKLSDEKRRITVRHLLQHASGFPSYLPYYRKFFPVHHPDAAVNLVQLILQEPLVYPLDTKCLYSDLGFIMLGACVEALTAKRLDFFFRDHITDPLGLTSCLTFLPLGLYQKATTGNVAATEDCPWRGKVIQGEVHDEHCWLMGGVAGHAGLFGTAKGVQRLCEWLLDIWRGRVVSSVLSPDIVRKILTTKHAEGEWCLGFDTPTPGSSSGQFFSSASVGHLGFSGASFWIDPVRDCCIVLLTNRIYPSRENTFLKYFRPYFHDQLMKALFY